ncbi:MAG: peptidylprolyl isomerase [bacterium]
MRFLLLFLLVLPVSCKQNMPTAEIVTEKGSIVIELYKKEAPKTVENFIKLSRKDFYNGLTFHRVVPDFVAQGGDPQGTGRGGPGYTLPAEIAPDLKHVEGAVAMARLPDSANPERRSSGSQFYICLKDVFFLDGQYTIFGQVRDGMAVVKQLAVGDRINEIKIR